MTSCIEQQNLMNLILYNTLSNKRCETLFQVRFYIFQTKSNLQQSNCYFHLFHKNNHD